MNLQELQHRVRQQVVLHPVFSNQLAEVLEVAVKELANHVGDRAFDMPDNMQFAYKAGMKGAEASLLEVLDK